ncbi:MAG: DUF2490 domain-containing protein [Crocinitomicaceae bacterium]|nr:DUF2490 domain-containing protein [Crocinitomicaceae bacterium]
MNKIIVAFAFCIVSTFGFSQESDLGNWIIYFGNKKINSKFNWHHEVQYRNYNAIGDLEQLLLRTGIGYNLTEKNNNLLLGYGFIRSENYIPLAEDKAIVNEHRVYQQFITKQSFGRVKVQHRYRLEERWVDDSDFKLRFRYFLALNVALNHNDMIDNTVYLSAYNELFINHQNSLFDRNRLYGGVGYKLNSLVRFELGYMNQFFGSANRDQVNVIAFVSF